MMEMMRKTRKDDDEKDKKKNDDDVKDKERVAKTGPDPVADSWAGTVM